MPQRFPHEAEVISSAPMKLSGLHQEGIEAHQMPSHARAKHAHHRLVRMLQSLERPPIAVPGPPQSTVLLLNKCQQAGQMECLSDSEQKDHTVNGFRNEIRQPR